jgi:hypothetical protein
MLRWFLMMVSVNLSEGRRLVLMAERHVVSARALVVSAGSRLAHIEATRLALEAEGLLARLVLLFPSDGVPGSGQEPLESSFWPMH